LELRVDRAVLGKAFFLHLEDGEVLAALAYVVPEAIFRLFEERPQEDRQQLAQREVKEYKLQEPKVIACVWLIEVHIDPLDDLEEVANGYDG
jgi:hypothetical protein